MALPRYVNPNRSTSSSSRGLTLLGAPKPQVQQNAGQVAQLTSRTTQAVGNLVNQYIADAEATKYANTITGISQGLAEVNTKYQNPNEYLEGANKYVKGYTSNLSESEAARIQATVGKSINSTYVRKHASYTAAQDKKAEESLEAAKTGLIDIYKGLPTATEEDLQQREVVLTELDNTLQLQKQRELRNVTDPEIARAIEIKYAAEREGIVQDAGLAKLISYAQTQRDPYSIVMDLMQGTSELTGFENLKPATLFKALSKVQQLGNANIQAEAEAKRLRKQQKDAVLLQYAQAYQDPNTTDAQRDEMRDNALFLADTAKDYENIDKIVDAWDNRLNASDPMMLDTLKRLHLEGEYDEAQTFIDENLGDGISTKDAQEATESIRRSQNNLMTSPFMKNIRLGLEVAAPTKTSNNPLAFLLGDTAGLPNGERNKKLHLEKLQIIEEMILSGQINTSAELVDVGNKITAEVRKQVQVLDEIAANDAAVQRYVILYRENPNGFVTAVERGDIVVTPEQKQEIAKQLSGGN